MVVHDGGAGVEARERGGADLLREPRRVRIGAVDGRFEDDRGVARVAHGRADGPTTRPTLPASVRAPSTWIGRAVHHDVLHPDRLVGGEALGVGREVAHPPHRPGCHRRRVEDRDVGPHPRPQVAAVGEPEDVGLPTAELADGLLHRHHALVAHPLAEQVGGLGHVAELARVRAGVGEAEHDVLLDQEIGDALLVVVGDHRADPQRRARAPRARGRAGSRAVPCRARRRRRRACGRRGRGAPRSGRWCRCPSGDRRCRSCSSRSSSARATRGRRRPECARRSTRSAARRSAR